MNHFDDEPSLACGSGQKVTKLGKSGKVRIAQSQWVPANQQELAVCPWGSQVGSLGSGHTIHPTFSHKSPQTWRPKLNFKLLFYHLPKKPFLKECRNPLELHQAPRQWQINYIFTGTSFKWCHNPFSRWSNLVLHDLTAGKILSTA